MRCDGGVTKFDRASCFGVFNGIGCFVIVFVDLLAAEDSLSLVVSQCSTCAEQTQSASQQ